MDSSLLSLPWQIQFSLATGYAGYALAYTGIRAHHQTIDVAFRTLVFSAIATVVLYQGANLDPIWAAIVAALATLVAGVVWRAAGRPLLRIALAELHFAHSDDDPSVTMRLATDSSHHVTQASVTLNDGTELHCDNTAEFRNSPIAPLIVGRDGSVGLYVTRSRAPGDSEDVDHTLTKHPQWGHRLTIVPSHQVKLLDLRYMKKR